MSKLRYEPVRALPVAKFYYKGNHSHPVRRTVLVIEQTRKSIRGYELRCGFDTQEVASAPIKTYSREKIAKYGDLRRDSRARNKNSKNNTTLNRMGLLDLVVSGV